MPHSGRRRGLAAFVWAIVVGLATMNGVTLLRAAQHEGAARLVLVGGVVVALAPFARGRRGGVDRKGLAGAAAGLLVVALLAAALLAAALYGLSQQM